MYCLSTYTWLVNTTFVTNTRKPSNGTIYYFFNYIYWIDLQYGEERSPFFTVWNRSALQWQSYIHVWHLLRKGVLNNFLNMMKSDLTNTDLFQQNASGAPYSLRPGLAPPQVWCYAPRHAFVHWYMVKEGERRADMAALEKDYEGGCRLRWVGARGWLKAFKNRLCFIDVRGTQTCLIRPLLLLIAVNYC